MSGPGGLGFPRATSANLQGTALSGPSTAASSGPATVQEYSVRLSKAHKKVHHVMSFNATLKVDFAQWKHVRMERENNMRELKVEEEQPKFGAGSEYMREQKEDLRRKKLGIIAKKYKQDAQPWLLKVGGKGGKKFRGTREGGITEYASYYVFAHAPDGAIEAYPLHEWYNFQPSQRYKALSAEQAEEEFKRRRLNLFTLMSKARLKGAEENAEDPEEKVKLSGKKKQDLRIDDLDDVMMDSADDSDASDDEKGKEDDSDGDKKKKGKKQPPAKKKKKKKDSDDDEAFEESDDGDEEGREMDYIESSDEDESEDQANKEMKSVAEEDGLRTILNSDSSDDEEEKHSSDESNKDEEKKKEPKEEKQPKETKKKKLTKKGSAANAESSADGKPKESLSDLSSDSDVSDSDSKNSHKFLSNIGGNSRPSTPLNDGGSSGLKRKLHSMPMDLGLGGNSNGASENSNSPTSTPAKRTKSDSGPSSFAGAISNNKDDNGITEEAVRRYLMRKPMTTTELLTKFKNKKTGVSSDKLVETMTQILKKINPVKQIIQQKMYLSIKNK